MTLISRLLRRFLPERWTRAEIEQIKRAAEDFSDFLTEPEEKPMPLPHKDSERQAAASRGPFTPATGCCPFMRSGGFHGEDCYDQGREDCTPLKRGRKPEPTSPRAITARHAIPPPPRKPRK